MGLETVFLNENDTKELRKNLGLPLKKKLIYWMKVNGLWNKYYLADYEIVETLQPSGSHIIKITLESGKTINILSEYLADMQTPSFLLDVGGSEDVTGRCGIRIDEEVASYVVVDIETTGKNHFVDEITEIGAIKYNLGKETERFNMLLKTDVEIPKKVEELTGITNSMLQKSGIEPQKVLMALKNFLGDMPVVGHNFTSFDSKFLEDAYVKELKCHFSNDFIDTLYLAKKVLPKREHYSLESLSEELNIDYSKAHRAVEDCVINHYVYEYLTFGTLLDENVNNMKKSKQETSESDFVEIEECEGWKAKISAKFPDIIEEYDLTEDAISLLANTSKDGKITSYAICLYESEIVEDKKNGSLNTVVARVKEDVLKTNPNIVEVFSKNVDNEKISEEMNDNISARFDKESDEFIYYLVERIKHGIENYSPKAESFACCARYEECSKRGKCVHPRILLAKACEYRKNVEAGRIFY